MGFMFRLIIFTLFMTVISTIISVNSYADYRVQMPITLGIFAVAYAMGVWYFKTAFKENQGVLTLFAAMLLISIHAYGFGVICLLKQFECGTVFIRDIATYQIISKNCLNITSGILVAIIAFLFGGVSASPGQKEWD